MSDTPSVPAGWYADPRDPRQLRWWSGDTWTEHVAPAVAPAAVEQPLTADAGNVEAGQTEAGQTGSGPTDTASSAEAEPAVVAQEATPVTQVETVQVETPYVAPADVEPASVPPIEHPIEQQPAEVQPAALATSDALPSRRALREAAAAAAAAGAEAAQPAQGAQGEQPLPLPEQQAAPASAWDIPVSPEFAGSQDGAESAPISATPESAAIDSQPDSAQPEVPQPAFAQPEAAQPAFAQPEAAQPAFAQPEVTAPPTPNAEFGSVPLDTTGASQPIGFPGFAQPAINFTDPGESPQRADSAEQAPVAGGIGDLLAGTPADPSYVRPLSSVPTSPEAVAQWGLAPSGSGSDRSAPESTRSRSRGSRAESGGRRSTAVDADGAPASRSSSAAASESTTTAWAWIIALSPLIAAITFGVVLAKFPSDLGNGFIQGAAALPYLIVLGLAWFDNRTLVARGVERPAAWTWAALTAPIYLLMRRGALAQTSFLLLLVWFVSVLVAFGALVGYGFIAGSPLIPGFPS